MTDRRVKITSCSGALRGGTRKELRVFGLGSSVSPGIRDTTPQEARSWLFRHTQTHTSYEIKIATLPLIGAKPPTSASLPSVLKNTQGHILFKRQSCCERH